jgi:hypothetical protein
MHYYLLATTGLSERDIICHEGGSQSWEFILQDLVSSEMRVSHSRIRARTGKKQEAAVKIITDTQPKNLKQEKIHMHNQS